MREVVIAGLGMTRFDIYDGQKGRPSKEFYDLGAEAILKALDDAEVEWKEIQAAFCGSCYQGVGSGHQAIKEIGLTGIPIVNVENACSSGPSAFRLAYQEIAAGFYDIVLVVGLEKMPRGFIRSTSWREWERYMGFNVQPAAYALQAVRQMEEYGHTLEQFAKVTVKNRKNGVLNPYARFQKEVTVDEVLNSRLVCKPLRLLNCCPLADGGVAVILCSKDRLKSKSKITVAATVLTSGTYGHERGSGSSRIHTPTRTELAAKQAYEISGYGPEDINLVEAYDTMSNQELISIAELGFCNKEDAGHMLEEGEFDINGKIPVNVSGGLMARGHPLGATGLAQIAEVFWQLRGEAGSRQIPRAKIGLCHTMGAGPSCSVTILKS